jgi:ABC-type uncharacterized transport system ATPase subunit
MNVEQVLNYFGDRDKTAKALSISVQAIQQWVSKDSVPEGRQWQIQALSKGKLLVDSDAA